MIDVCELVHYHKVVKCQLLDLFSVSVVDLIDDQRGVRERSRGMVKQDGGWIRVVRVLPALAPDSKSAACPNLLINRPGGSRSCLTSSLFFSRASGLF